MFQLTHLWSLFLIFIFFEKRKLKIFCCFQGYKIGILVRNGLIEVIGLEFNLTQRINASENIVKERAVRDHAFSKNSYMRT